MKISFIVLCGLAITMSGCKETNVSTSQYEPDRPYYFAGAALKNYPVRVYEPIDSVTLYNFKNAYYEVLFDDQGRVVVLRSLLNGSEMWKTVYLYQESGAVKEERWSDSNMEIVRLFSSNGKLIRVEKTQKTDSGTTNEKDVLQN